MSLSRLMKDIRCFFRNLRLARQPRGGVVQAECQLCGSANIKLHAHKWLRPPYAIPESIRDVEEQLLRRDNGQCDDCGLVQSFYHFTDEARRRIYALGLEELSDNSEFQVYPPRKEYVEQLNSEQWKPRIEKWEDYFQKNGVDRPRRMLQLRSYFGESLQHFVEKDGTEAYVMEMIHSCQRYIHETIPGVTVLKGQLNGRIEIEDVDGEKFDLIVIYHVITHSLDMRKDLELLRSLLTPNGVIIFCEEVSQKTHNPFHILHPDEATFTRMLKEFFPVVDRIDDCGPSLPHTAPYTRNGDNPDFICQTKPQRMAA